MLTERQINTLMMPLDQRRVSRNPKGFSHLEAWDVRRTLNRVFGFTGWEVQTLELTCVAQNSVADGNRFKHTIVYRAQVRLTVKDENGNVIGRFEDGAAGDAINQPSMGDAHDMAMKTALSQALKRCAVNLGDQFGLSLYNDGDLRPVVNWSVAYPKQEQPKVEDAPVRPDPEDAAADAELDRRIGQAMSEPVQNLSEPPTSGASITELLERETRNAGTVIDTGDERMQVYGRMVQMAQGLGWDSVTFGAKFAESYGVPLADGTIDMYRNVTHMMEASQ